MTHIRPAAPEDYPDICRLVPTEEELFLVYPRGRHPLTVSQLQELARIRKALTVATIDDRIVGFAILYDFLPRQYAFIGNVVVDRQLRGEGIGSRLVSHMIDIARKEYHLPGIRISVFNTNTPAMLLYCKFGFTPFSTEVRTAPDGQRVVLIHMGLALSPAG